MNTATDKVVRYIAQMDPSTTIPDVADINYLNTPGSLHAFKTWALRGEGAQFNSPQISISAGDDHIEHDVYALPLIETYEGETYTIEGGTYLGKVLGTCDFASDFTNADEATTQQLQAALMYDWWLEDTLDIPALG